MSFKAVLEADIGNWQSNLNKAGSQLEAFVRKVKEQSKGIRYLGDSFINVGKKASILSVAVAAAGAKAFSMAADFESAFAGVRKTVDATETEFAILSDGIRKMSMEIPSSADAIARVAEAAGQLGIENDNILTFTRTMIDLGQATNLGADQAATQLARLANIMRMNQNDFGRLGSTIVELGNNFATTEAEISEMALRLAGAGKQVGLTEAEVLSISTALSSVGINAEAGGTAISKVMMEMQLAAEVGGDALNNFARVAGVSADDFARAFRDDAAGALVTFISGLENAESAGTSAVKVLDDLGIVEIRMRDALLRSAGAGDLMRQSLELGTKAWEENTALTEEAEERYKTVASQLSILKNNVTDVAIQFGDILLPKIIKVIDKLKDMTHWLSSLSPEMQSTIVAVAGVTAAVGPLLLVIGQVLKTLPILKAALVALTGPIGIVVAAIVAATALIIANWDKLKTASKNVVDALISDWDYMADHFKTVSASIGKAIRGDFAGWWDDVKKTFDTNIEYIKTKWQQLKGIFKDDLKINIDQTALEEALRVNELTGSAGQAKKAVDDLNKSLRDTAEIAELDTFQKLIGEQLNVRDAVNKTVSTIENLKSRLVKLQLGILPSANVRKEIAGIEQQINDLLAVLDLLTGGRELNIKVPPIKELFNSSTFDNFKREASDTARYVVKTLYGLSAMVRVTPEIDTSLLENSLGKAKEMVTISSEQIGSLLSTGISMFAQTIGDAFAGNWDGLGAGLLKAVGSLAQQFGGLVIGMAIAADQLKKIIVGNPLAAIAAGAALIALGAAASGAAQKMISSATGGGGGGYSSAPSLRNTGPGYAPSEYRGQYQDDFKVEFKIGTNELVGVLNTAEQRRNRL